MKWQVLILLLGFQKTLSEDARKIKYEQLLDVNRSYHSTKIHRDGFQTDIDRERTPSLVEDISLHDRKTRASENGGLKKYDNKIEDTKYNIPNEHLNNEKVNNTNIKYAPRFKNLKKLFHMYMKPAGSSMKLRCLAEGNPAPNVTWYKNGVTPIVRRFIKPSYGKWSLTIHVLMKFDGGNYTCIVCNELDCIQHTTTLHVHDRYRLKPYIKEGYPGNVTVQVNDTVQFSCPQITDLEPFIYWLRLSDFTLNNITEADWNNMLISAGDVIESEDSLDSPETLTLYNVKKKQEGWYVCMAFNSMGNTSAQGYLTVLEEEEQNEKKSILNILYEQQTVSIALLWNDELGHAAAALLRDTLIIVGYKADLIKLYNRKSIDPSAINSTALIVEVPCPYFQVRLTARAARSPACKYAHYWTFYQNPKILRKCDFLIESIQFPNKDIYVVNEINRKCAVEVIRNSTARVAISSTQTRLLPLKRANLTDMIRNSNNSFLFLDTYEEKNSMDVRLLESPRNLYNCTFEKTVLLKYANNSIAKTYIEFSPSLNDLYRILDDSHNLYENNMENAARQWMFKSLKDIGKRKKVENWLNTAVMKPTQDRLAVIICKSEGMDLKEYLYMINALADYENISISTLVYRSNFLIQVFFIDCADTDWFLSKLTDWYNSQAIPHLAGVVLTADLAAAAAPFAKKFGVSLFTYDVNSDISMLESVVHLSAGSVKHQVIALRRLLADCGWQRLAIISDTTGFAKTVSDALQAPTTELIVRDMKVTSTSDIPSALKVLLDANARVFLVNTDVHMAAAVLAAANKINITRDKGFAWIVFEYYEADNATLATMPYSISFSWRGERENKKHNERMKTDQWGSGGKELNENKVKEMFHMALEKRWRGRAWPLYAASLLDILLKFKEGFSITQISRQRENRHGGTGDSLVFVQQWDSESRPRVLAAWRGGELRKSAEACPTIDPPPDGSSSCLLPSGDPFQPSCRDAMWITCAVFACVGMALIIAAIRWSRNAISAYKLRVNTKFAKRMLARRDRVFEALSEHLVDRKALELLHELGTGRFGRVNHGLLRELDGKRRNIVVAVKVLREDASSAEESEFLREACTLATFDYKHIIGFVGVCVVDGPPLLLMEQAFFGDLLQYLQARRCLIEDTSNRKTSVRFGTDEKEYVSAKALTKLAQEAAMALAYLAQRGIVHRDVRASNCLVDEQRCLKLADFGLARATGTIDGEYQMCRRGVLPVLWMAPESLAKGVSSPQSDVWSFGVLVFELVTLGRRPYGVQPPSIVLRHVIAGGQPQLPWDASAETRTLTRACWRREPEARPTAARLVDWLSTRCRALRPALVAELVDIDKLINDKDFDEPDFCNADIPSQATE